MISAVDPYTNPLEFCGIVEGAVQEHYQGLLVDYWLLFLTGGVIIGLVLGYVLTMWYLHKKGRVLQQYN